jgi:hypothetical protein
MKHASDWVKVLGSQAEIAVPTYGVLMHHVRTNEIDLNNQKKLAERIKMENSNTIKDADITYVGWLTRSRAKKQTSSLVVEFTRPEDANKAIEEGLVMEAEIHACELYDRSCKLKQCF